MRQRESWVKDEKGGKTVEEGERRGIPVSVEFSMWIMVLCSTDSILFA